MSEYGYIYCHEDEDCEFARKLLVRCREHLTDTEVDEFLNHSEFYDSFDAIASLGDPVPESECDALIADHEDAAFWVEVMCTEFGDFTYDKACKGSDLPFLDSDLEEFLGY